VREPLPPPLPPETRTVGQLVAETIRLYGRRFWPSLALGVPPAALGIGVRELSRGQQLVVGVVAGSVLLTACYIGAAVLASDASPGRRTLLISLGVGLLIFVPVPVLSILYILPALIWLALAGLAVPAAVIEGLGFRAALRRGIQLGRADYVHALGSLATLAILAVLSQGVLFFLLREQGDATLEVASFLASVVISPVILLGSALLYFDQAARVVRSRPRQRLGRRRRDAHLHHADEPDRAGSPDPEVESRPAAGGQQ
jgi:hypothetical protein